ncbi:MAG: hypothetical protein ACD_72C00261G0007 [uncultured bacterium]|nr:MAG: hypothetical protein ACD_72C00261G0007 [uncultured bacterium]
MGADQPPFIPTNISTEIAPVREYTESPAETKLEQKEMPTSGTVSDLLPLLAKKFEALDPTVTLERMERNFIGSFRNDVNRMMGAVVKKITTDKLSYSDLICNDNNASFLASITVGNRTIVRRCILNFKIVTHNGVDILGSSWLMNPPPKRDYSYL